MRSLDEIRAGVAAATDGPWYSGIGWVYTDPVYPDDNRLSNVLGMSYADPDRNFDEGRRAQHNAEFIANARTDIPELVDALTAAQTRIARLQVALAVFTDYTAAGIVVAPVAETAEAIAELIADAQTPDQTVDTGMALAHAAAIAREYAAKEA